LIINNGQRAHLKRSGKMTTLTLNTRAIALQVSQALLSPVREAAAEQAKNEIEGAFEMFGVAYDPKDEDTSRHAKFAELIKLSREAAGLDCDETSTTISTYALWRVLVNDEIDAAQLLASNRE
jgi:hypothetical protein